jgi:hypothetical protein
MALALTIALLGVLLAVLAIVLAVRTERHVRRLAQALAREWGLRTGSTRGPDEASAAPPPDQAAPSRREVEALEQQLRALEERLLRAAPAVPQASGRTPSATAARGAPAAGSEPHARVEAHLLALGFEEVVLLPGRAGGTFVYEAREAGMPRKGAARVDAQGAVRLEPAPTQRAFP